MRPVVSSSSSSSGQSKEVPAGFRRQGSSIGATSSSGYGYSTADGSSPSSSRSPSPRPSCGGKPAAAEFQSVQLKHVHTHEDHHEHCGHQHKEHKEPEKKKDVLTVIIDKVTGADKKKHEHKTCVHCGAVSTDGHKYCTKCGNDVKKQHGHRHCPKCDHKVKDASARFCPKCGSAVP
eukprot:m51a1_g8193 hypothetical protein (177) ;mRNA; f:2335-2865